MPVALNYLDTVRLPSGSISDLIFSCSLLKTLVIKKIAEKIIKSHTYKVTNISVANFLIVAGLVPYQNLSFCFV